MFCRKLENCSYESRALACLKNSLPSIRGLALVSLAALDIMGEEEEIGDANADGEKADFSPGVSRRIAFIAAVMGVAATPPPLLNRLRGSAVSKSFAHRERERIIKTSNRSGVCRSEVLGAFVQQNVILWMSNFLISARPVAGDSWEMFDTHVVVVLKLLKQAPLEVLELCHVPVELLDGLEELILLADKLRLLLKGLSRFLLRLFHLELEVLHAPL